MNVGEVNYYTHSSKTRCVFVDYKELIVMEKYKEILNNFENYPKSFL